ncbi:MAG: phage virion morphogenesis protein [Ginsengibacter sp.]
MASQNKNINGVDEVLAKLYQAQEYLKNDVKQVIGTEAVKHFKQNFVNEGFDGKKWAPRRVKVRLPKKILTGQGSGDHLSDSIDFKVSGNDVIIYSDKIYSEIQNEGGEITVTAKMKKLFWAKSIAAKEAGDLIAAEQYKWCALAKKIVIPKREFIGPSEQLNQKITDKITRDLTKILS